MKKLLALCLVLALLPIEFVFAVIDNLTNRRMSHRGDAKKIHLSIIRFGLGDTDRHDPVVFAFWSNQQHLFEMDAFID